MTPYLRLLGAQLAIGAAAIFARFALTGTGPLCASALRLAIAALPVALVVWLRGGLRRPGLRVEAALAAAGIALALHFGTWLASLEYTSVALSTLFVCTSPLWTELYEIAVRRRRVVWQYGLALALAAAGLALVLSRRQVPAPISGHAIEGALLALAGGAAIGAYLLIVTWSMDVSQGEPLAVRHVIARTYTWAAVVLALASAVRHEVPPSPGNVVAWSGILAMAIVSQSLGHTALNAALRDFPATTVAISTLLEPVAAGILAAIVFGEALVPLALAGGVCVLVAIGFAAVSTARDETRSRASSITA